MDDFVTIKATIGFNDKIIDFNDCFLTVAIADGKRRCLWYCYDKDAAQQLMNWLRHDLNVIYVVDK